MYEFFLTAIVVDEEILQARALLQGYCAMPESHQFHRVLFFRGPDRPDGFKKVKDLDKIPNGRAFRELQQYLSKQSYVLQARYPLSPSEFGAAQPGYGQI
jgi:mediator of RNA polymerase II transcription subunit 18